MGVPTKTAAEYLNDSLMQSGSDLHALTQEQACTGVGVPALNTIENNVETAIQNRLPALGFMRLQLYRKVLLTRVITNYGALAPAGVLSVMAILQQLSLYHGDLGRLTGIAARTSKFK